MKKIFTVILLNILLIVSGCSSQEPEDTLRFGIEAQYPPFEFYKNGKITGFDIELANLIAKELGKQAVFEDMQFSAVLPALKNGTIDAAISTITITPERKENFDFSQSYYTESMAMVYPDDKPIDQRSKIAQKRIACQLGSTMEIWLKKHYPFTAIITMDNNNQAIEALKAGHVDGVLVDSVQGIVFSQKNPGLAYSVIAQSDTGYGIAVKKGSALRNQINSALQTLEEKGTLQQLKYKWLESNQWNQ